ncbi:MAG: SH3 domain-containing protein [Proteobacteria bacterium]|nr:SH3 domain-containing protein [Pseudomonadota bacterium]
MIRRFCFGIIFLFVFTATAHAEMVSVSSDQARMRSGPGEKYPIQWELSVGFPLKVIARQGKWLKVTDYESDKGWIYKPLVAKTPHMIVKAAKTIIRSSPGDNQRMVANANRGVGLRTIKQKKGWVQVKHESGLVGWVRRDTLWGW